MLRGAGLDPEPSDANFVLVRAPGLRDRLAPHGVLVRDCASFGLPDHVRIAVPDDAGLARLEEVLCAAALMVCGTASDVGKSSVVAGLCRVLHRRGVSVAPFKAQNMANNSYVTPSGHEIGRAQGVQALAAGAVPEVAMNPILLKPTGERTSQVVVMGRPAGHLDAAAYQAEKPALFGVVLDALADLRSRFDVVIVEGAGSPAEINLLHSDIVNLRLAAAAGLPAIVVGDIDRGGVFAAFYGTVALLPDDLRPLVRGFVVNKLRGDPALLADGPAELERRCGVPTLGVLPYLHGVALDAEDSLALAGGGAGRRARRSTSPSSASPASPTSPTSTPWPWSRRWACASSTAPPRWAGPTWSSCPAPRRRWPTSSGCEAAASHTAIEASGAPVLGICGGYQMMGRTIVGRRGVEAGHGRRPGLARRRDRLRADEGHPPAPGHGAATNG